MVSKAFGSRGPKKPHLLRGSGGLQSEINDLRADVEAAMLVLERRLGQDAILTQPGASPYAVVFLDEGMENTSNNRYRVFVGGDTGAKLLPGSQTTTGLTLVGGVMGDKIHLLLVGVAD